MQKDEIAVIHADGKYYWLDFPVWGDDLNKEDAFMIFDYADMIGYHACNRSHIWDDMTGYTDELQNEEFLPAGRYVVCYYWFDGQDLQSLVDYNITNQQIVENVIAQKYVEGANYFRLSD